MKKAFLSIPMVMLLVVGITAKGNATTISYSATDLTDVTEGKDLWEYSYHVTGHAFAADTGFTIYFDLGLHDRLNASPSAPNTDWDVIAWDPDPLLPDDGAYDAYALVDNASLTGMFSISFVWLGGGTGPGSQFFEVYDGFTWSVLDSGNTTLAGSATPSPVPLSPTLWLFGSALIMFFAEEE